MRHPTFNLSELLRRVHLVQTTAEVVARGNVVIRRHKKQPSLEDLRRPAEPLPASVTESSMRAVLNAALAEARLLWENARADAAVLKRRMDAIVAADAAKQNAAGASTAQKAATVPSAMDVAGAGAAETARATMTTTVASSPPPLSPEVWPERPPSPVPMEISDSAFAPAPSLVAAALHPPQTTPSARGDGASRPGESANDGEDDDALIDGCIVEVDDSDLLPPPGPGAINDLLADMGGWGVDFGVDVDADSDPDYDGIQPENGPSSDVAELPQPPPPLPQQRQQNQPYVAARQSIQRVSNVSNMVLDEATGAQLSKAKVAAILSGHPWNSTDRTVRVRIIGTSEKKRKKKK